jgi:hypothetical protein
MDEFSAGEMIISKGKRKYSEINSATSYTKNPTWTALFHMILRISRNSINLMTFVMAKHCKFCEVGTEF